MKSDGDKEAASANGIEPDSKDPSLIDLTEANEQSPMDPIDFVLVWYGKDQGSKSEKSVLRRQIYEFNLETEGLVISKEDLNAKDLHFTKIYAPLEVLQRYGEILRLQMPIKEVPGVLDVRKQSFIGKLARKSYSRFRAYFRINPAIFPKPGHDITAPYNKDKNYLFDINEFNLSTYFSPAIRSRIIHFILKRTRYSEDDNDALAFGYERLINCNAYKSVYPLHDGSYHSEECQRGLLFHYWASFRNCMKFQPLDAIRMYFGAKVANYFAWLGFYTSMLIIPSIMGIICFFYGTISIINDSYTNAICSGKANNRTMCPVCENICEFRKLSSMCVESKIATVFDNDLTAVFAFFMSIWTVVFLEIWKRYSAELNHQWHLNNFTERDQAPRPEYVAKLKNSTSKQYNFITNTIEPAVPFWRVKLPYTIVSLSGVLGLMLIALAASIGVIVYRISVLVAFSSLKHQYALWLITLTGALINVVFILIFSYIYEPIAKYLTDLEIPRTYTEYESSFAFKLYALEFINHYGSLLYIAFFKGRFVGHPRKYVKLFGKWRQEECEISCMPELCIQLAVVMIGLQAKNALRDLIIPFFLKLYHNRQLRKTSVDKIEVFEKQILMDYRLLDWRLENLTEEYLEMVIQYGFITIFSSAFPLAPFFALLNNVIELRSDAQKFVKHYKRPVALRGKGIGIWYSIMETVAKIAVLSNAFIIAITSNFVDKFVYRYYILHESDPRYGTLDGFLEHSLCQYEVRDIETSNSSSNPEFCSFPAYRNNYNESPKYEYNDTHWKVWLGRVIFVIAFQNIVAACFFLVRWAIPDVPEKLQQEIQREEYLTNELIIQQELLRARARSRVSELPRFSQMTRKEDVQDPNQTPFNLMHPESK